MSVTPEPGPLGPQISLFEHALRLHRLHPDAPLPREGYPYPDEARPTRRPASRAPEDRRREGVDVAAVLDAHFANPTAPPSELAGAFNGLYVPIQRNEHIAAAALRADEQRVRQTGRWLVRHGTDRNPVTVGLALLTTSWAEEDIPLIQTIGLLSDRFGPLAAYALRRRLAIDALIWLADRVSGWGRVYVVEQLCAVGSSVARPWLLRQACDGDFLNGYFAGKVATQAHLHEAITQPDTDDDLVDHTGRVLKIMTGCGGMGMTVASYPPARLVLAAHADHLSRQPPAVRRYLDAAIIADHLAQHPPKQSGCTEKERQAILTRYLAVLDQDDWCAAVRPNVKPDDDFYAWFTGTIASRLRLRAFAGLTET
ncbi:hypothetical protein [Micromonospora sp. NPDC004704]